MSRTFRATLDTDWPSGTWYQRSLHSRQRRYCNGRIAHDDYDAIYEWPIYNNWEGPKEHRGVWRDGYPCYCRQTGPTCHTCQEREVAAHCARKKRRILSRQKDKRIGGLTGQRAPQRHVDGRPI